MQIIALINKGKSCHSVALQYNLVHDSVNRIYQHYVVMRGSSVHRSRSGYPKAADNQEDRNITRIARQNPYLTLNKIAVEVNFFDDIPTNSQTVCR